MTTNRNIRRSIIGFSLDTESPSGAPIDSVFFIKINKTKNEAQNIQIYSILEIWSERSSNASANKVSGRSEIQGDHTWPYRIYFDIL